MPFDEKNLPPLDTEEGWFLIPEWGAGTWHKDCQITRGKGPGGSDLIERNYTTYLEPIGWQKDKSGGIWHYYHLPCLEMHDLGDSTEAKLITHYTPLQISNQQCVICNWYRTIRVNKATHLIELIYQQEEIDSYKPTGQGQVRQDSSVKWFDAFGKPCAIGGSFFDSIYSDNYRIKPFMPVNFYHDKDMRTSLKTYLISHGMAELVPDDSH
jgi:hypothetical protein